MWCRNQSRQSRRGRGVLVGVIAASVALAGVGPTADATSQPAPAGVGAMTGPAQSVIAGKFIRAMKNDNIAAARTFVDAVGPGGIAAVVRRPDYVYDGHSSWEQVRGADCHGYICQAAGFPATPEPGWYVVPRAGRWRVVARAYLDTADYLLDQGEFGCLTESRLVFNRRGPSRTLVLAVPAGTPVWWAPRGRVNVAVDAGAVAEVPGGSAPPRTYLVFGFMADPAGSVQDWCGD